MMCRSYKRHNLSGMLMLAWKCTSISFITCSKLRKGVLSNILNNGVRFSIDSSSSDNHSCDSSIFDLHKEWVSRFNETGVPDPETSIRYIIECVLGIRKAYEYELNQKTKVTHEQEKEIRRLCECRLARMPVQYIIKEWDFRELRLAMCPPVFIPRPETEQLVDLVMEAVAPDSVFLEVGCGSGAISLSLLKAFPNAQVVAIDQSRLACQLTINNSQLNDLTANLCVVHSKLQEDGSLSEPLPVAQVDVLVSNPPYVPSAQLLDLQPEIKLLDVVMLQVVHSKLQEDGSLSEPLPVAQVDVLVSNPPYVPSAQLLDLQPEIKLLDVVLLQVVHSKLQEDGSLSEPLPVTQVDVLVSNPPYVPSAQLLDLQPEIKLLDVVLLQVVHSKLQEDGSLSEPLPVTQVDVLVSNPPYVPSAQLLDLQPEIKLLDVVLLQVVHSKLQEDGSLSESLPVTQVDVLVSNPPYVPSAQLLDLQPEIKLLDVVLLQVVHSKLQEDGSLSEPLPVTQVDVLVSNPPYVPSAQLLDLQPEIKLYEDLRALEAGRDGLRVVKALFRLAQTVLKPGGLIFLEVDSSHPRLIEKWLTDHPQLNIRFVKSVKDFCDKERFVELKKC